jgi:hypothetical protein
MNIEKAVSLLGKSEQHEQVRSFLKSLSITLPLKRPSRGENQINLLSQDELFELCFTTASLPLDAGSLEDELFLTTVFAHKSPSNQSGQERKLLFGLSFNMSRSCVRKKLGTPSWSSPMLNNDRWAIDGVKILVCFSDNEAEIYQIAFSLA